MRHYVISGTRVTICRQPPAKLAEGDLLIASAPDLHDSALTMGQLMAIRSALPGAGAITKMRSRKAAVERLWAALQVMAASKRQGMAKIVVRKRPASKQEKVIEMLRRREGATVDAIARKIGWQQHSVRGLIAGALKKKLGLIVTTEKRVDGIRLYRMAGDKA